MTISLRISKEVMPAKSENQRRAAGMALSAKRGKTPMSKLTGAAKTMSDMSETDLEHFAKSAHLQVIMNECFNAFQKVSALDNLRPDMLNPETTWTPEEDKLMRGDTESVFKKLGYNHVVPDGSGNYLLSKSGKPGDWKMWGHEGEGLTSVKAAEMSDNQTVEERDEDLQAGERPDPVDPENPDKLDMVDDFFQIAPKGEDQGIGDKLKGGLADATQPEAPQAEVRKGIDVEMEHTNDPAVAREITNDHLEEHDKYYTALSEMEDNLTEEEGMPMDAKEKVAFVIGFARECALQGLQPMQVKTAATVVRNMVPGLDDAFKKVAGDLSQSAQPPAVSVQEDVVNTQEAPVIEDPSESFMVGHAKRRIKEEKLDKGGVTPSSASVFKGPGNRIAIDNVAKSR